MIDAIIFDNDGLLIDSEPVWDQARHDMAEDVAKIWSTEDHQAVMGVSTTEWANYMIDRLELSMDEDEVVQEIVQRMVTIYKNGVPFLPGAKEAIQFAANNYPTAIASGSHPDLLNIVAQHPAVQQYIKIVISADTVENGKPAPDVYLEAAKQLDIEPEKCLCLEDSSNGILAGIHAGMTVVAVPDERFPPNVEILSQAHYTLKSLYDFPKLMAELKG